MKKLWYIIRNIFLGIWVVVMLIAYTIWTALCYPVRNLQYRKSHFFRETGAKFTSDAHLSASYILFNRIREAGLPMEYLPGKDPLDGWFFFEHNLILHKFDELSYSETLQSWTLFPDDEIPLEDTLAEELRKIREIRPDMEIGSVRILLDRVEIDPKDLPMAKQLPMFLIYDGEENRIEVLRRFCEQS